MSLVILDLEEFYFKHENNYRKFVLSYESYTHILESKVFIGSYYV